MLKQCTKCSIEKDIELFAKDKYKKDGRRSQCKGCNKADHQRRYTSNPEKERDRSNSYRANLREVNPVKLQLSSRNTKLKKYYGLSIDKVEAMKKQQNYCCFICKEHESTIKSYGLVVDHSHETGSIRKLLCSNCNTALGLVKENISILNNMVNYIETHTVVPA